MEECIRLLRNQLHGSKSLRVLSEGVNLMQVPLEDLRSMKEVMKKDLERLESVREIISTTTQLTLENYLYQLIQLFLSLSPSLLSLFLSLSLSLSSPYFSPPPLSLSSPYFSPPPLSFSPSLFLSLSLSLPLSLSSPPLSLFLPVVY